MYGNRYVVLGLFTVFGLSSPSFAQQAESAESIYEKMEYYSEDFGKLRSFAENLRALPVVDLVPLIPKLKAKTENPHANANLTGHTARTLLQIAIQSAEKNSTIYHDILSYFEDLILADRFESDRQESRDRSFVRQTAIFALHDAYKVGSENFQIDVRTILEKSSLSGLPSSDVAVRLLEMQDQSSINFYLTVAVDPQNYEYARSEALRAISRRSQKLEKFEQDLVIESLVQMAYQELCRKNPSESTMIDLIRALSNFNGHLLEEKIAAALLHLHHENQFSSSRLKGALYEALTTYSHIDVALANLLDAKEERDSYGYHYLLVARSQILALQDSQLTIRQKVTLWEDLIDYLQSTKKEAWKRTSILPGLRLAFTQHIAAQGYPEGSDAWKGLPDSARALILIEIPESRPDLSGVGAVFGLLTGGFGFFLELDSRHSAAERTPRPPAYYNLKDDLLISSIEADQILTAIKQVLIDLN